jgi:hypothetical protein
LARLRRGKEQFKSLRDLNFAAIAKDRQPFFSRSRVGNNRLRRLDRS